MRTAASPLCNRSYVSSCAVSRGSWWDTCPCRLCSSALPACHHCHVTGRVLPGPGPGSLPGNAGPDSNAMSSCCYGPASAYNNDNPAFHVTVSLPTGPCASGQCPASRESRVDSPRLLGNRSKGPLYLVVGGVTLGAPPRMRLTVAHAAATRQLHAPHPPRRTLCPRWHNRRCATFAALFWREGGRDRERQRERERGRES